MRSEIAIARVFCLKYTKFVDFAKHRRISRFFNDALQIKNFSG